MIEGTHMASTLSPKKGKQIKKKSKPKETKRDGDALCLYNNNMALATLVFQGSFNFSSKLQNLNFKKL